MTQEKKRCYYCQHRICYGLHAFKAECPIKNISWNNYTSVDYERQYAEECESFTPRPQVFSMVRQAIVDSKTIHWI